MTRRFAAVLAVVGALVLLTSAPATAHASLLRTDPADRSVVAATPQRVVFTFNEPIRMPDDAVHAFRADGSAWNVTATVTDNRLVVTPAEDPGTGTVVVAWKVISADGHIVGGALTFSIGSATRGGAVAGGGTGTHTSVTVLRWVAAGVAGLALLLSVVLSLCRRRTDPVWNLGFAAAVLLTPLHELADGGRSLSGLGDWLVWVDGVTRTSSLLLLAAYAVVAAARTSARRVVTALVTLPALVLLGGAAYSWPSVDVAPTTVAGRPSGPTTGTAQLGDNGTVQLTTSREADRAVTITLVLLGPDGTPLEPYASPTLTVSNPTFTLGDATLTQTGPGAYRAELSIPTDGSWTAQVSVRIDEFTNPVAEVPFTIG
jgi:copper transport protein